MARLLKWALIGAGVVVLLFVAAAVAVYFLVDPEDYRGLIIETVEEQTGRTLKIDGELTLDLFPCCGIAVGGAELGNPAGFKSGYFARADEIRIGIRVIPLLLRRSVEMGELRLIGLDLALEEKATGATNWSFDTGPDVKQDSAPTDADTPELSSLSVAGVTIRDATISYKSEIGGTDIRIADLSLQTDRIAPGQPFSIDGGFNATDVASDQSATLRLASQAQVSEDPVALVLSDLALEIDTSGVTLKLSGTGSLSGDAINLAGGLDVPEFSPQAVLKKLGEEPIETADSGVLRKLSATGAWVLDDDRFAVDKLELRLDDSVITGQLQNNYGGRGDTSFDLKIDSIDFDRYLAPESDGEAGGSGADAQADDLPLETLRSLDVQGKLSLQSVKISDVRMTAVNVEVSARDGRIALKPMSATMYGGRYSGQIALNATGKQATLSLEQAVQGVNAATFLKDFAEMENIEGLMNARIVGNGRGNNSDALIASLKGDVSFDLQDGLYKDLDVWWEIRRARSLLRRKAPPPAPVPEQTEIKTLSLKGRIADSVFASDQIIGEIPFLTLTGSGTLGLVEQNLDYRFKAKVIETPVFEDGANLDDLTGLTIPVQIKGSVEDPKITVDLEDLAKDAVVKKGKEKLLEKLLKDDAPEEPVDPNAPPAEEKPKDILKRGLKDLLGN